MRSMIVTVKRLSNNILRFYCKEANRENYRELSNYRFDKEEDNNVVTVMESENNFPDYKISPNIYFIIIRENDFLWRFGKLSGCENYGLDAQLQLLTSNNKVAKIKKAKFIEVNNNNIVYEFNYEMSSMWT